MPARVTGTTFIRNAFDGGFPIFESLLPVLAITDHVIVVDLGSTDGTLQILQDIASKNNRLSIAHRTWSTVTNPSAFADIANECVNMCDTDGVFFWQADEILHENLAKMVKREYNIGNYNMTFERIQLSQGGHQVRWLPHPVCRSITKGKYVFDKDGMSVADSSGCKHMCRNPSTGEPNQGRQFLWSNPVPGVEIPSHESINKNPRQHNDIMAKIYPWDEFLVDTSSMFRDNQAGKKSLHCSFWNENDHSIDGIEKNEWLKRAFNDPIWERKEPTFIMPSVAKGLCGMPKYRLRDEIKTSLCENDFNRWGL
jgi:glycosyltransferase involved in cell wall biosynthesis